MLHPQSSLLNPTLRPQDRRTARQHHLPKKALALPVPPSVGLSCQTNTSCHRNLNWPLPLPRPSSRPLPACFPSSFLFTARNAGAPQTIHSSLFTFNCARRALPDGPFEGGDVMRRLWHLRSSWRYGQNPLFRDTPGAAPPPPRATAGPPAPSCRTPPAHPRAAANGPRDNS